jgi:hypothetical protein
MTDLLERPATADAPVDLACPPHRHTDRCWWHPAGAAWVCPPGGTP